MGARERQGGTVGRWEALGSIGKTKGGTGQALGEY